MTFLHLRAPFKALFGLVFLISSTGCTSIARGVTSAIIEGDDAVDERLCKIEGVGFSGLEQGQFGSEGEAPTNTTRMLIVHGIGPHSENYSEVFTRSIANGLKLYNRELAQKRVRLGRAKRTPGLPASAVGGEELGWMTITRFMNDDGSQELLTFEVLWSDYNEAARKRFINADEDTEKYRASVNNTVKAFFNQQVIDPVKYLGDNAAQVRGHVRQAACWMLAGNWDDYPAQSRSDESYEICPLLRSTRASKLSTSDRIARKAWAAHDQIVQDDRFVAVTHSLGSRIFLDAFTIQNDEISLFGASHINPFDTAYLGGSLRNARVTLIMLANQLPLLQQGLPENKGLGVDLIPWENSKRYNPDKKTTDSRVMKALLDNGFYRAQSKDALCRSNLDFANIYSEEYAKSQRRFKRLELISVSDPNDLLSYKLLSGDFVEEYLDWRLCTDVTEVTISVTKPVSLFGLDFANPSSAHGGYWTDRGLAQLLISGTKNKENKELTFAVDQSGNPTKNHSAESVETLYDCNFLRYKSSGSRGSGENRS